MSKADAKAVILFAEDIREERTGQVTVVGLHGNIAGVSGFPITIDRLAALIDVALPADKLPRTIGFVLKLDGEKVLAEARTDVVVPPRPVSNDKLENLNIRIHFRADPFELQKKSELRMAVFSDDEEIGASYLVFSQADPQPNSEVRRELPFGSTDSSHADAQHKKN